MNEGKLTVNESTIAGNTATATSHLGGGIYNNGGTVKINNSTFFNNSAFSGGAIGNNGKMVINSSTISGNSAAGGYGAGIINSQSQTITITNTAIAENFDDVGKGGGICNDGILNYQGTIIANNNGGDCILGDGSTININNHNLVGDDSCSPLISGDPGLESLADNGGPTLTHALLSYSPALNKVPNGLSQTDQRGAARDYNGEGNTELGTDGDIGSFEFREPTVICGSSTGVEYYVENVKFIFILR